MGKERALRHVLRWLVVLLGGAVGLGIGTLTVVVWRTLASHGIVHGTLTNQEILIIHIALLFFFLLLTFAFSWRISGWAATQLKKIEQSMDAKPVLQLFTGAIGLTIGLVLALLITQLFNFLEPGVLQTVISVLIYLLLGYLGVSIASRRWREFAGGFGGKRGEARRKETARPVNTAGCSKKILDTSVIIDGRIFDICKTGFVEGVLVVPQFVLHELQHIADSSDALRRNRGRRGLDVLQRIQKELEISVEIEEADYLEAEEVDVKLLKLAQDIGGIVMTNDYNLNKVASVTGVQVLNINELANALKPVVLHGEEMVVHIVREGKEPGQGVGYLDDGTMIVVDNGKAYVGQTVEVLVTTVLQTAAGRMIFTKIKHDGEDKVG